MPLRFDAADAAAYVTIWFVISDDIAAAIAADVVTLREAAAATPRRCLRYVSLLCFFMMLPLIMLL